MWLYFLWIPLLNTSQSCLGCSLKTKTNFRLIGLYFQRRRTQWTASSIIKVNIFTYMKNYRHILVNCISWYFWWYHPEEFLIVNEGFQVVAFIIIRNVWIKDNLYFEVFISENVRIDLSLRPTVAATLARYDFYSLKK